MRPPPCEAEPDTNCRHRHHPLHVCSRRGGAPLGPGETCWMEARSQLAQEAETFYIQTACDRSPGYERRAKKYGQSIADWDVD